MFVLASQPFIQEFGAIIAIGFGVLITSFLHIATLRQHKMIAAGFRFFVIPYAMFILVCVAQTFAQPYFAFDFWTNCAITILLLTIILLFTNQLKWQDFSYLKSIISRRS